MFHYTDKDGWNAIRSQIDWKFKVSQPKDPNRPQGAYFTDIEPSPTNLRVLYKRIRVPKDKQDYVFWFQGTEGLTQLNEGTGRDRYIYFSEIDYVVVRDRQRDEGPTVELSEKFA